MPRGVYKRTQKHIDAVLKNAEIARKALALKNYKGSNSPSWKGGKPSCIVCGKKLSSRGYTHCYKHVSEEHKQKFCENHWTKGENADEIRARISQAHQGKILSEETREKVSLAMSGSNHWNWKEDRSQLKKKQERNDSAYQDWRNNVYKRDNYKCRINNCECSGRIIAHHILSWSNFPELRYEVNNGITLCQFHHPLKRNDEKNLIPTFQELVIAKVIWH